MHNHGKRWTEPDINSLYNIIKNKTIITDTLCENVFGRNKNAVRIKLLKTLYDIKKNGGDVTNGLSILGLSVAEFDYNLNKNSPVIITENKKESKTAEKFEYIKNQFEMLNKKIDLLTELLKKNELNN